MRIRDLPRGAKSEIVGLALNTSGIYIYEETPRFGTDHMGQRRECSKRSRELKLKDRRGN
jgi:hypothetical protein